jgi:hypothetical protein
MATMAGDKGEGHRFVPTVPGEQSSNSALCEAWFTDAGCRSG